MTGASRFLLNAPLHNSPPIVAGFVPCDQVVQTAYLKMQVASSKLSINIETLRHNIAEFPIRFDIIFLFFGFIVATNLCNLPHIVK